MSHHLSIPSKTLAKLANPEKEGSRHQQILEIAVSLASSGLNPDAIFCQVRPNYGPDVPDSEIQSIIKWAGERIRSRPFNRNYPTLGTGIRRSNTAPNQFQTETKRDTKSDPLVAINRFLKGRQVEELDLLKMSPVRLHESSETGAHLLVSNLFEPGEMVNIVSQCRIHGEKANPIGFGETSPVEVWLSCFEKGKLPIGKGGVWVRTNPMDGKGVSDENVSSFRFLLVEFDEIPLSRQLPFLVLLRLPISAIISSGGRSYHAWVRINAKDSNEFRTRTKRIFTSLESYGLDTANSNPSRLSRLPGVHREIGGGDDSRQRLLYLDPDPSFDPIII